jgi:hypothetical protein
MLIVVLSFGIICYIAIVNIGSFAQAARSSPGYHRNCLRSFLIKIQMNLKIKFRESGKNDLASSSEHRL